jgi:hypothetical protein
MKVLTRLFSLLTIMSISTSVYAREFKHFQLNADKSRLQFQIQGKSGQKNQKPMPGLGNILSELQNVFEDNYQSIGHDQVRDLIDNHDIGGGVYNFSGFTWYKPMLNYHVSANREIAPELFSDKWIVHDSFTIFIDAASLLTNLRDGQIIDITDEALELFVGVSFQRKYHYFHYADTYLEGLTSDYSKLLMSFLKFTPKGLLSLNDQEIITKEDTFNFYAGGGANIPIGGPLAVNAALFTEVAYKNLVSMQSIGKHDQRYEGESTRLSISSEFYAHTQARIGVQLDFFQLLKLTLLSYELNYEITKTKKTHLSFAKEEQTEILKDKELKRELSNIITGSNKLDLLSNNIVSHEQRLQENLSSTFGFLLLGKMKKRSLEQIRIIKDGIERVFYRSYSESLVYIQSFLSKVFGKILQKLFQFDAAVKNNAEISKKMTVEYEKISQLDNNVNDESQLSIKFTQRFYTHKTKKKSMRKRAIRYAKNLTNLSDNLISKIKNKELKGPLTINSTLEITEPALRYFNQVDNEDMVQIILKTCRVRRSERINFKTARRRKELFRKRARGRNKCAKNLITRYEEYQDHLNGQYQIDIDKFKKFIGLYYSQSRSLKELIPLFGEKNIFMHGDFRAKTQFNRMYQTYFKAGNYRGLGVIDRYRQAEK